MKRKLFFTLIFVMKSSFFFVDLLMKTFKDFFSTHVCVEHFSILKCIRKDVYLTPICQSNPHWNDSISNGSYFNTFNEINFFFSNRINRNMEIYVWLPNTHFNSIREWVRKPFLKNVYIGGKQFQIILKKKTLQELKINDDIIEWLPCATLVSESCVSKYLPPVNIFFNCRICGPKNCCL